MSGSLRGRLLLGAGLWTIGLFVLSLTVSTALMLRNPSWARAMHSVAHTHVIVFSIVALA